jgi:hypothetical protein
MRVIRIVAIMRANIDSCSPSEQQQQQQTQLQTQLQADNNNNNDDNDITTCMEFILLISRLGLYC